MIQCVFYIFVLSSLQSLALEKTTIEGTLLKKNKNWFLYVNSEKQKIRKGSLKLVISNKLNKRFLKERLYIQMTGQVVDCLGKHICYQVESIRPSIRNAIKNYKDSFQ